jgi:hypothetical protein
MSEKPSAEEHPPPDAPASPRIRVKRPLVPVVLALMVGLAAAAWGLHIPGNLLLAGLAGLLGILLVLWILAAQQK